METVQPSSYTRSSIISTAILLIVLWGFHRTYTMFFPSFEGFVFVQHFHGFMMLIWLGMLIVQPLLIASKKHRLHRLVGSTSYLIAPLMMLSIFLVSKMVFHRDIADHAPADAYADIALSIPSLITFGILYWLAISNRRRTYYHMRYMIGTGILMIGPGLGRLMGIWFGVPGPLVIISTLAVVAATGIVFMIVDVVKRRDYKPYGVLSILLILELLLWESRYTEPSQFVWHGFANIFF
jgi:hypothetical protein